MIEPTKEWLYQKYIVEDLTQSSIAKLLGCGNTYISNRVKKYNIRKGEEFAKRNTQIISKDLLSKMYIDDDLNTTSIAVELECSDRKVSAYLRKYGLTSKKAELKFGYITKEWLYQKYIVEDLSQRKISSLIGCGGTLIHNRLKKHGISKDTNKWCLKPKNISKEVLINLYTEKSLGSVRIARILNCSSHTVIKYLNLYGMISKENSSKYNKELDVTKNWLEDQYLNKKLSSIKIAESLGVEKHTILRYLKKYNIKRRTISESATLRMSDPKEREKISGENHYNWQNGKTELSFAIRNSYEYKQWRLKVYKRDNWTCQFCEQYGGKMAVDHIKPFASILKEHNVSNIEESKSCKELWNTDNGRVLCYECHKGTDSYGWKYFLNYDKK